MSLFHKLLFLSTKAIDTIPDSFSFSNNSGVNPNSVVTSNTITPTGFNAAVSWSISGGTASISGGSYTTSGTISPGQTVTLRVTSSAGFGGSVNATFILGGVSTTWTVTTRNADTYPDNFSFGPQFNINPSTVVTSNTITPTGYEVPIAWSITGGTASVGGGSYTTSGTISPGQTVAVRVTSSGSFNGTTSATFTAGGNSGTFTVMTRVPDSTPNAFSFVTVGSNNPSTLVYSNTITLSGFDTGVNWSCSGGTASVGGGSYTTSGIISPGQTVTLRVTSNASYSGSVTATFTAGGVSGTFTANTRALDTTPNAFSFASSSGAEPSSSRESSPVTITGFDGAISWSTSGGTASISGGAHNTSGTITAGQTVAVRLTTSSAFSTSKSATFTAGGVSGTFTVTTRAVDTTPNISGWTPVTNAARGATIYSSFATVDGFDGTLSWTGTTTAADAGCSVSGGSYAPSGTITSGQTMRLFCISSTTPGGTVTVTININGTTRTWSVKSV